MKHYFTISEFAKLRNININSLRYYEKLGLLKPAYTDPQTKYRYYTPEQLSQLDTILLCINLGLPLKQLVQYVDENGYLQNRALLEDGKALMEQKVHDLHIGLKKIEYTLQYLDANRQYSEYQGLYTRTIGPRTFFISEYTSSLEDIEQLELRSSQLFSYAQQSGLAPVLPTGLIFRYEPSAIRQYLFFEIADQASHDPNVIQIPSSDFLCVQADLKQNTNLFALIEQSFGVEEQQTIILSNMVLDRFQFDSRRGELQKLLMPSPAI